MSSGVSFVFDLDGTLVDSDAFDGALYAETVREIIEGVEVDESWQRYHHVTDEGILAEILEERGLEETSELRARVRKRFGLKVARYLASGDRCRCVPGAQEAIAELQAAGHMVGIATGGWGHTARMKLAHAGFSINQLAITSSDDSSVRVEIMNACLRQLGGTPDRAVYVGDGPWDMEASRRAGWMFIGVGERLKGCCSPWIADFTDPAWRVSHNNALHRAAASGGVGA